MTKEEQILSAILQDRLKQCETRGYATHTGFLTPAEVSFAEQVCIKSHAAFVLDGGYPDAERRICAFLPVGADPPSFLSVLRLTVPKAGRSLTHRDYLGALLSLGIERSVAGDILVREDGADIIVLREMADYLAQNLTSVGRLAVSAEVTDISQLDTGSVRTEEFRDTVASLRLDSIVSSAFRLSRGKAQEAVKQGLVFINGRQVLKSDAEVSEGDRISLRGRGKALLSEVGSRTRKDRISIRIQLFV